MRIAFSIALVLNLARQTLCYDENSFQLPKPPGDDNVFVGNQAFPLGSVQNIQWLTSYDTYNITLNQQFHANGGGGALIGTIYSADGDGAGTKSFKWTVTPDGSDLSASPVYFLWLFAEDASFTCHYFNITTNPLSSTSTSTKTTSRTGSAATSSTKSTSSDLSTSDAIAIKVGLGVGLGIGIPLILIAGFWVGMKAIKDRRSKRTNDTYARPYYPVVGPRSSQPPYQPNRFYEVEAKGRLPDIHEAPGHVHAAELDSIRI